MLTISTGIMLEDIEQDDDYICYEEPICDEESDDGVWWDGYSSEAAFWECNGI